MTLDPSMRHEYYVNAQNDFRVFYEEHHSRLLSASTSIATLLELLLTDHERFSTPTVLGRIKLRDECLAKFDRKYRGKIEDSAKEYRIRDFITDLIGLRVVCLYDDEVTKIRDVLSPEFEMLGITDKAGELDGQDGAFGYRGLHLDVKINPARCSLPEYRRFSDLQFEIQIRTTIQDSWSKIDHQLSYKRDPPLEIKRRLRRLAALTELADQEFRLIRDDSKLKPHESETLLPAGNNATEEATSRRTEEAAELVQFGALRDQIIQLGYAVYGKYPFTPESVDSFVKEILTLKTDASGSWMMEAIARHKEEILRYKEYQRTSLMARMNPYTLIRHILFADDEQTFSRLLFPRQIDSYLNWKENSTLSPEPSPAKA